MDPPPLPPLSTATVATATSIPLSYPDSLDSPRDGAVDDDPLPPKLRLMCSFGGHIIPRPHDKSLCYVGGETHIVVVDRHSSLADLSARLSLALLHSRPFALKYQLPTEDLDSLISVTNDEDLLNMIDEYDRAASPSPLRPSRLRLFLFFTKSETATSMGTLLEDSKSETWFFDALNNAGILPRGLSDSSTGMDCLVNPNHDPPNDLEAQIEDHNTNTNDNSKQVKTVQDVQFAMPDSPVVENSSSSYGSSSSSPSMSNLPPIRVQVDQRAVGIDDQLAQMSIAAGHQHRHDDGYGAFSAPPPPFPSGIMAGAALNVAASASMANQAGGCGENMSNRAASDDERSDQGAPPTAFRKPPLPMLQPMQVQPLQHKASAAYNLPSPDSVASDSSIASASSLSRPTHYEDQSHVGLKEQRSGSFSPTRRTDPANPTPQAPIPQAADPSHALAPPSDHLPPLPPQPLPPQTQQQQFVHLSTHYIPHPAQSQSQSPVLVSSCYPVYQMQSQQLHHPVYMMPDGSVVGQARPLPTSSPASAQPAGGYKDLTAPIYHATKTPSQVMPGMVSNTYNSYMASHQPLIQVPAGQYQQQHSGTMAQINRQPQPAGGATNYAAFNYSYSAHDLAYYSQHQAPVLPSQYQNLLNAGTMVDAPKQPSGDSASQQIMTLQPL